MQGICVFVYIHFWYICWHSAEPLFGTALVRSTVTRGDPNHIQNPSELWRRSPVSRFTLPLAAVCALRSAVLVTLMVTIILFLAANLCCERSTFHKTATKLSIFYVVFLCPELRRRKNASRMIVLFSTRSTVTITRAMECMTEYEDQTAGLRFPSRSVSSFSVLLLQSYAFSSLLQFELLLMLCTVCFQPKL